MLRAGFAAHRFTASSWSVLDSAREYRIILPHVTPRTFLAFAADKGKFPVQSTRWNSTARYKSLSYMYSRRGAITCSKLHDRRNTYVLALVTCLASLHVAKFAHKRVCVAHGCEYQRKELTCGEYVVHSINILHLILFITSQTRVWIYILFLGLWISPIYSRMHASCVRRPCVTACMCVEEKLFNCYVNYLRCLIDKRSFSRRIRNVSYRVDKLELPKYSLHDKMLVLFCTHTRAK